MFITWMEIRQDSTGTQRWKEESVDASSAIYPSMFDAYLWFFRKALDIREYDVSEPMKVVWITQDDDFQETRSTAAVLGISPTTAAVDPAKQVDRNR